MSHRRKRVLAGALRLSDLEPRLMKRLDDTHFRQVTKLHEADGVQFVCPKCFVRNARQRMGVHSICCWSPTVPQTTNPTPGRWTMHGTSLRDLTLVSGSSSVLVTGGCCAHFYITNGAIVEAEKFA